MMMGDHFELSKMRGGASRALLLLLVLGVCEGLAKFTRASEGQPCFAAATSPASPSKAQACSSTGYTKKPSAFTQVEAPVARRLFDEDGDQEFEDETRANGVKPLKARPWMAESATRASPTASTPPPEFSLDAHAEASASRLDPREAAARGAEKFMEMVLALRAWMAMNLKAVLSCKVGEFVSETLPQVCARMLPSKTMIKGLSELLMLSVSVWVEAICRIFKLQFSVILHALWRQGLVIAHSFSRLSADTHMVPNTPVLERRRAELRAKSAAHDVRTFRCKMAQLQHQMAEASARLRDAEADAAAAARSLSIRCKQREREEAGAAPGGGVTRLSLGASPRKPSVPSEGEADYDWRLGGGTNTARRAWG